MSALSRVPRTRTGMSVALSAIGAEQDFSPKLLEEGAASVRTPTVSVANSYEYFLVLLTAQNEFFGDQTYNVNVYAPLGDYTDCLFFIKNTSNVSAATDIFIEYFDVSVPGWVAITGATLAILQQVSVDNPPQATNWMPLSVGAMAAGFVPVRAQRSALDAGTDLAAVGLYLRRAKTVTTAIG